MPHTAQVVVIGVSIRFHMHHETYGGRVRIWKYCELENREVRADEIGKGYEWSKDRVIPITDHELWELQALSRSSRVPIAKWAVRGRERLGLL